MQRINKTVQKSGTKDLIKKAKTDRHGKMVADAPCWCAGLSVLLLTGVLKWKDCLQYPPAWDTLFWFAVLVGMSGEAASKILDIFNLVFQIVCHQMLRQLSNAS